MNADDLILVSVDDHLVEPPGMFEGRLPARLQDRAPRVVRGDDGGEAWHYEDEVIVNIGLVAVAGRPPEEYGTNPTAFSEMRPGCWDIHERIADMNANGQLASLCFPSFPQFCGQLFSRQRDKELALATIRAYNDWHLEEWAGSYPGRMIPLAVLPLWDPQLMAEEVRRVAALGCHAVTFSENPHPLGYPSLHTDHWDPFFAACCDEGTVVCTHIGSSSQLPLTAPDAPVDVSILITPVNLLQASSDILWSRILNRFPLKIALSEGGIGWIPYFLERADYVYKHHHRWTHADFGSRLPSEVFREHMITCFIDDEVGLTLKDSIGIETICWESDYPHSDSTWPNSPEVLWPRLRGLTDGEVVAVTHENALRHFRFDAFTHVPRDQATVAALRARVPGRDLTFSTGRRQTAPLAGAPVAAR